MLECPADNKRSFLGESSVCWSIPPTSARGVHGISPDGRGAHLQSTYLVMMYGMYLSAEGANAQAKRLEFVANNLANVETPGFKRDVPTFQARFAEAIQQGQATPGDESVNDVGGGVKLMEVNVDFSRATFRQTGIPTDFAVNGEGFFRVQDAKGQEFLTRAGDFELDATGQMKTQGGQFSVLDNSGKLIKLDPQLPWDLLAGGNINQADAQIPIGLTTPESLGDLVKVGNNVFRSLGPTSVVPSQLRDIRQGYLEQSGVSSIREMNVMIETTRAFEANTQLIQHQDSMVGSLISKVLTA
ncbi:MAG: flagellar hook-basal body protein [Bythopirellula sp.]|nr:flagellar hook-basal body protein [Bythopirellula sp.]